MWKTVWLLMSMCSHKYGHDTSFLTGEMDVSHSAVHSITYTCPQFAVKHHVLDFKAPSTLNDIIDYRHWLFSQSARLNCFIAGQNKVSNEER